MSVAKEIKAVIRESKLDEVVRALHHVPNLPGITMSRVMGFGRTPPEGSETSEEAGMCKLEIVVPDSQVAAILDTIEKSAWTGRPGDGKIFVVPVDEVVNIRRKTRGAGAI